ncbi:hypothetical protein [Dactylosporangium sp. NPDC048998]|uniref:hypothetical protein n=1 Tax=Dactylosporangium sp. NPDC048998 TaxID=3363976 RepID=UPI003715354D
MRFKTLRAAAVAIVLLVSAGCQSDATPAPGPSASGAPASAAPMRPDPRGQMAAAAAAGFAFKFSPPAALGGYDAIYEGGTGAMRFDQAGTVSLVIGTDVWLEIEPQSGRYRHLDLLKYTGTVPGAPATVKQLGYALGLPAALLQWVAAGTDATVTGPASYTVRVDLDALRLTDPAAAHVTELYQRRIAPGSGPLVATVELDAQGRLATITVPMKLGEVTTAAVLRVTDGATMHITPPQGTAEEATPEQYL